MTDDLVVFLRARLDEDESLVQEHWGALPGRDTREVAAKRGIVELHGIAHGHECSTYDRHGEVDTCTWCLFPEDCSTLRLLAAVYGDHPDYRAEWKPQPSAELPA